jgi:hypothetical protein
MLIWLFANSRNTEDLSAGYMCVWLETYLYFLAFLLRVTVI